jgi:hypothetical protein
MQLTSPKQVLASPFALLGYLFFTAFTPELPSEGSGTCSMTGKSKFYGITIDSGAGSYCDVGSGAFSGGANSINIGAGIASQPIISIGPGGLSIHVSTSGAGGQGGSTTEVTGLNNILGVPHSSMIYWKDRKLQ